MAFLVVGGMDLDVVRFRRQPTKRGASPKRTLSGRLRGDALWTARAWEAGVFVDDDADADALYLVADGSSAVACSGDALRGAVTCVVDVTGDEYEAIEDRWVRVLTLSLEERL